MSHQFHRWLLVGAWTLCVTGCLRVDEQFALKTDGTGTYQVEIGLESKRLDELRRDAIRSVDQPGVPPVERPDYLLNFTEGHIAGSLRSNLGHGLELEHVERRESNGWSFVSIRVKFDRVSSLNEDALLGRLAPRLHRVAPGTWRLVHPALLAAPNGGGSGLDRGQLPDLPGIEGHIRWTVPGRIVAAEPALKKDGVLEWRINDRADRPDPAARKTIEVEFSGEGLTLREDARTQDTGAKRGGT